MHVSPVLDAYDRARWPWPQQEIACSPATPATSERSTVVASGRRSPDLGRPVGHILAGASTRTFRVEPRAAQVSPAAVTGSGVFRPGLGAPRSRQVRRARCSKRRLTWEQAGLVDDAVENAGTWDVVCCHGVVMYLQSLAEAVATLVSLARAGAPVSLLSRNQAGIAMRAGMAGSWSDALDGFDAERYTNRLGLDAVRADRPEAATAALDAAGAETLAWYGVRLFTDHFGRTELPCDLDDLLAAEERAGERDFYRQLTALTPTLATRRT